MRSLRKYLAVNGGVLFVAWLVTVADRVAYAASDSELLGAAFGTAVLYLLVYRVCAMNLRGRTRVHGAGTMPHVPLTGLLWHPLGSTVERFIHGNRWAISETSILELPMLPRVLNWHGSFVLRLLAFELAFDLLFYAAHRSAHSHPLVYQLVHKLHHKHTHDVRLLSALQMSPLDVAFTHTLPVLGALAVVPLAPGFEYNIGKTYLLFQEFYGHAGVENRGRNFGPAPWIARLLDIELRSEDHQRHHIRADVNFSKRFSIFDKLFCTWSPAEKRRGCAM